MDGLRPARIFFGLIFAAYTHPIRRYGQAKTHRARAGPQMLKSTGGGGAAAAGKEADDGEKVGAGAIERGSGGNRGERDSAEEGGVHCEVVTFGLGAEAFEGNRCLRASPVELAKLDS